MCDLMVNSIFFNIPRTSYFTFLILFENFAWLIARCCAIIRSWAWSLLLICSLKGGGINKPEIYFGNKQQRQRLPQIRFKLLKKVNKFPSNKVSVVSRIVFLLKLRYKEIYWSHLLRLAANVDFALILCQRFLVLIALKRSL